jgi:acyl carrier protein
MKRVQDAVLSSVLLMARRRNAALEQVSLDQSLTRDLGLDSLDFAQLVARLELELDLDPFTEAVSVTEIRTVGDLSEAYCQLAERKTPPSGQA